ncbi:sigma factor G inhibitor Gin [Halobacillus litoralis]|uniref:sigma factor G inhibitor Gin n=1 Tax=Halobacillus litoralis TaxID=45668 RepID=UPI001CFCDDA3|nr:sigma factor G inhibitor Gin [Halobacillus litoralis]
MKKKHQCSICSKETEKGLYLLQVFICESCEAEMIQTSTDDPKYDYFVKQMSKAHKSMIPS